MKIDNESTGTTAHNPYASPTQDVNPIPSAPSDGDGTGGMIPYKNPHALIAYYLGLFSLFPILGFFLAVPAFVLGIMGLRNRKRNPAIKGSVHAWIGIIMGGIFAVVWGATTALLIIGLVFG